MNSAAIALQHRSYCNLCHHSLKDWQRPSEFKETTKIPSSLVSRPGGTMTNEAHHRATPFSAVTRATAQRFVERSHLVRGIVCVQRDCGIGVTTHPSLPV